MRWQSWGGGRAWRPRTFPSFLVTPADQAHTLRDLCGFWVGLKRRAEIMPQRHIVGAPHPHSNKHGQIPKQAKTSGAARWAHIGSESHHPRGDHDWRFPPPRFHHAGCYPSRGNRGGGHLFPAITGARLPPPNFNTVGCHPNRRNWRGGHMLPAVATASP